VQAKLPSRQIVLLGVGHTNAHIVRMWRMQPIPDAQLTCVSNFPVVTYSGMLPGVLAGQYPPERMQIDLVRLCASVGARLILEEVTGLDVPRRRLLFGERPPLPFDVLSIGIGSTPRLDDVEIDGEMLLPIKPMQTLLERLHQRLDRWSEQRSTERLRVVVVGGGAGGSEIAFCLPAGVRQFLDDVPVELHLVHANGTLIPDALPKTSRHVAAELTRRNAQLHLRRKVVRVTEDKVVLDDDSEIPADLVLWATGAAPPPLVSKLRLPTAADGFLLARPTLQTTADAPVFIVGDTGTRTEDPTPKAGVYAVRQGPVLWRNIRNVIEGRPLEEYKPQRGFLKLFNTGDGRAIGEYKGFSVHNAAAWKLKDFIDGRFMDKYQDYQPMMDHVGESVPDSRRSGDRPAYVMKCAGCGGKLGGQVLSRVLERLEVPAHDSVLVGLHDPDDAAILLSPASGRTVVTTDFFTAPLEDPWLVSRIAALNAASDAFAMGAIPTAVLAIAMIPEGPRREQEETLFQLLAGGLHEFRAMGATLVGGHTIEGPQLTIGYTVLAELLPPHVGESVPDSRRSGDRPAYMSQPCTKSSLQPGDALLLTKPLGTGVLLAAHMRAACPAGSMLALRETMLTSNATAARLAVEHSVRAMTDITGFGLAGHLLEMLRASNVAAELDLSSIPLLPGVGELLASGVESTLAPANRDAEGEIEVDESLRRGPEYAALFDPQTSGGLLIAVVRERVEELRDEISELIPTPARVVGRVIAHEANHRRIRMLLPD
jgi:selenide, water dikinase